MADKPESALDKRPDAMVGAAADPRRAAAGQRGVDDEGEATTTNPLSDLLVELDRVFRVAPRTPVEEREAHIMALVALARLAKDAGKETQSTGLQAATWGLTKLALALSDLNNGQVAPMLKPRKPNGRPLDSSVTWHERVRVLIAMHMLGLKKCGMTWDEAANYIAKSYPGLSRLMTRGKNLGDSILRWRRELDEAKVGSALGQFSRQWLDGEREAEDLTAQRTMSAAEWRQAADNLLKRL